jgi:hypothetical protein
MMNPVTVVVKVQLDVDIIQGYFKMSKNQDVTKDYEEQLP